MSGEKQNLLICTVGGSPEPIVAALKHWQPQRVHFVVTPETAQKIDSDIVPKAQTEQINFDSGRYELLELRNGQDFAGCLDQMNRLSSIVNGWLSRGEQYQIVVDFTGGTKCMSAALALQARRWRCVFSYVGGSERTKNGIGIVVSGKEQVLHEQNPWDALGFQTTEEYLICFDQQAFSIAAQLADRAQKNVSDASRKREFQALKLLAEAYAAWDRFDHAHALKTFETLNKFKNDLKAVLRDDKAEKLQRYLVLHRTHLQSLKRNSPNSNQIQDLLANAQRRHEEGRNDDAVARLYRVIEAWAQLVCHEKYQISSTKKVPYDQLPPKLKDEWKGRVTDGSVMLGLQDTYRLLAELGDENGQRFKELELDDPERSPLSSRNQSILAHGFEPVSEKVYKQMWQAALQLTRIKEDELPRFPKLG